MAAFIEDVIKIHHFNSLYASIENVALIAVIPNFFCKHSKVPCIDGSCIPCFFNAGDDAASFLELVQLENVHFLFGFDPLAPVA